MAVVLAVVALINHSLNKYIASFFYFAYATGTYISQKCIIAFSDFAMKLILNLSGGSRLKAEATLFSIIHFILTYLILTDRAGKIVTEMISSLKTESTGDVASEETTKTLLSTARTIAWINCSLLTFSIGVKGLFVASHLSNSVLMEVLNIIQQIFNAAAFQVRMFLWLDYFYSLDGPSGFLWMFMYIGLKYFAMEERISMDLVLVAVKRMERTLEGKIQPPGCRICNIPEIELPAGLLTCGHNFCVKCIHERFVAREGISACPICKKKAADISWRYSSDGSTKFELFIF